MVAGPCRAVGFSLLMVGADLHWSRAVRNVARDLSGSAVDAVPSGHAALARLAGSGSGRTAMC